MEGVLEYCRCFRVRGSLHLALLLLLSYPVLSSVMDWLEVRAHEFPIIYGWRV